MSFVSFPLAVSFIITKICLLKWDIHRFYLRFNSTMYCMNDANWALVLHGRQGFCFFWHIAPNIEKLLQLRQYLD